MVSAPRLLQLLLATSAAARRITPRPADETSVYLHDLVKRQAQNVGTISQNADGSVPLFDYEQLHLTSAQVTAAQQSLSKHFGSSQWKSYWNLFNFAASNVTSGSTSKANYSLPGPNSCKVFPGDKAWPSSNDWTALNVVTGGALLKPVPQAHVCYANGTGTVNTAACKTVSDNWLDAYWQNAYVRIWKEWLLVLLIQKQARRSH